MDCFLNYFEQQLYAKTCCQTLQCFTPIALETAGVIIGCPLPTGIINYKYSSHDGSVLNF